MSEASFQHPSSWTNRALRDNAAASGRAPWQTQDADLAQRIGAAARAAQGIMFPHLSTKAILKPPHRWFDAALARQVVVHVLAEEFSTPRRVIAAVSLMSREAVLRGGKVIAERMEDDHFAVALTRTQSAAIVFYRRAQGAAHHG